MKHDDLIKKLEEINLPEIETPSDKRRLKTALFSIKKFQFSGFWDTFNYIKYMSFIKKFAFVGVAAVVALSLVFGVGVLNPSLTPEAQAQEVIKKAEGRIPYLPSEMRAGIEEKIKADLAKTLEEAKQAGDITYLTQEEFEKEFKIMGENLEGKFLPRKCEECDGGKIFRLKYEQFPKQNFPTSMGEHVKKVFISGKEHVKGFLGMRGPGPILKLGEPVKYLKYTDTEGGAVVLGLDENDVPVMKIIKITDEMMNKLRERMEKGEFPSRPFPGMRMEEMESFFHSPHPFPVPCPESEIE